MSNRQLWQKALDDIVYIVDSARQSIPMDELFKDEEMYEPMRLSIPHFDLASWLMFDTEENRSTTGQLVSQLWHHIHKMRGVAPFLERIFDSYLAMYRVNHISDEGIYVQSILFPEPAVILCPNEGTKKLKEGDLFLGRILCTNAGYFLFHEPNVVPEHLREDFYANILDLGKRQPMMRENTKVYQTTLKNGNPEVLFLFAIAYTQAEEDARDDEPFSFEDEEAAFDLDIGEDGILALAPRFAENDDDVVSDMYILEQMETMVLMVDGVNLDDNRFTYYDELMEAAAEEGDFGTDEQMARIYEILHRWCIIQKNDAGRASLEPADEKILDYKRRLNESVTGLFRIKSLDDARGELIRPSQWIDQFDRYLEMLLDENLAVTQTGAINQKSLDSVREHVPTLIQTGTANREGSYPELVFFRKFALLKSMVHVEGGMLLPTIRMEQYLQLDDEEKVVLWVSTLLNKKFAASDPYFRQWPVQDILRQVATPGALDDLLSKENLEKKEEKIRWRIVEMGRELDLYDIALEPGHKYRFIPTAFGEAAFSYMGLLEKDNVISPF